MSITDEQDARLTLILGALEPEMKNMNPVPAGFVKDQCARHKTYGTEIFMSPKQWAWLERLYVEYIGDEEEQPKGADGKKDDMGDEVPF